MTILFVGVNYSPEITGIAPYTTAMAEGLEQYGHDVRVITGVPHYPQWKNFTHFSGLRRDEVLRGVRVRRVRHYIGDGGTGIGRVLQELTFGLGAVLQSWKGVDVVVCVSPALIASTLVVLKARLTGRPVGVWVQDLYANGAREIGGHMGLLQRILAVLEARTLSLATGVLVIHDRFKKAVVGSLGVDERAVTVSRNWSHLKTATASDPDAVRRRWFPGASILAVHTGNMGAKQALGNVVEAARIADETSSPVTFALVGDGSQRSALERVGADVDHLVFVPSVSNEEYSAILSCADVLLVNEKEGLRESAVPSKLTSYFAHGKAVVAATERDSATADEVAAAQAGPIVAPGKPRLLLSAIETLAKDVERLAWYGDNARDYAENHLTATSAVGRVSEWILGLRAPESVSRASGSKPQQGDGEE